MAPAGTWAPKPNIGEVGIIGVDVVGREPFGDAGWERQWGSVRGVATPADGVVGLDGAHEYESAFEVIGPPGDDPHLVALVDVENRGGRSAFGMAERDITAGALGYGRVQWQVGHCAGVPEHAQGVGLVIVRDFGRWLRERFTTMVIAGMSQSAWFVNTFVAEGFNVDPDTGGGVYAGAFSYLSGGNWLAINRLGDDGDPQQPYARPNGAPLPAASLLSRPATDPFLVEISSYTDYYRLRASVNATTPLPARARHYDFPSPHAPGGAGYDEFVFDALGCNGGHAVPLNPMSASPYLHALLFGLLRELDVPNVPAGALPLPQSVFFALGDAPAGSEHFNALPGVVLQVPRVDDDAQPRGGVRFPDVDVPLGRPEPVALAPCGTSSITDTCGNFGGWQPFDAAELTRRYGSVDAYETRYVTALDVLVAQGFVLESDRAATVASARAAFSRAG